MWTDTHTHLDKLTDPKQILEKARSEGVRRMITVGTEPEDWPEVLRLSSQFASEVFGTLGMHPHRADCFNEECEIFLKKHLSDPSIVAVGEIGLDYYYEHSPKDIQKETFVRQMSLAEEEGLPVEIHTRDAEEDTLAVLKEFQGRVQGILHCFTGSYGMAQKALDLGYNISFSGIVTFKKSQELQETCKKIPLNRLHIETDAPYLAPIPYRGKENQPSWVVYVARKVCELHNVTEELLSRQLEENTLKMFPKIKTKKA
ncbi:MAG: TatD family hydrolase [Bdellovibrionales bacterium]|nr:TatD family hydrolase [Bdellovibrionales bacterium]